MREARLASVRAVSCNTIAPCNRETNALASVRSRGLEAPRRPPFDKLRANGLFKTVSYLSFTPLSAKYFAAPGWNGIGEAAAFWFSSLKFSASLCTAIRSSRLSKMVLTIL